MSQETLVPEVDHESKPSRETLRELLRSRLLDLPLRATVAFATRCAKRVEPVADLSRLVPDAFSSGLGVRDIPFHVSPASAAAFYAAAAAYGPEPADAVETVDPDDDSSFSAAMVDLDTLRRLGLGPAGDLGEPIRWNDPRLGPLWPEGPPRWHVEAEQWVKKLQERLASPPMSRMDELSADGRTQFSDLAALHQKYGAGELARYRGEYVIFAKGTILGHGEDLRLLRSEVEPKGKEIGVAPDQWIEYHVDD